MMNKSQIAATTGQPAEQTKYVTQSEAASTLRLSERTLERHRSAGTGPAFIRLGRRILYRMSDLNSWADGHTFRSTSEAEMAAGTYSHRH